MDTTFHTDEAWTTAQVAAYLGTSRRKVLASIGVDGFPAPRYLGPRTLRWSRLAVEEWLATTPVPVPIRRNGPRAVVERV